MNNNVNNNSQYSEICKEENFKSFIQAEIQFLRNKIKGFDQENVELKKINSVLQK